MLSTEPSVNKVFVVVLIMQQSNNNNNNNNSVLQELHNIKCKYMEKHKIIWKNLSPRWNLNPQPSVIVDHRGLWVQIPSGTQIFPSSCFFIYLHLIIIATAITTEIMMMESDTNKINKSKQTKQQLVKLIHLLYNIYL